MRFGIRAKLLGTFFILTIFFLAASASSYLNASAMRNTIARNSLLFEEYRLISTLDRGIHDYETNLIFFIDGGDQERARQLRRNWRNFRIKLTELNKSTMVVPSERPWVKRINRAANRITLNMRKLFIDGGSVSSPEAAEAALLIKKDISRTYTGLNGYTKVDKREISDAKNNGSELTRSERNLAISVIGMVILWFSLTALITQNITVPLSRLYRGVKQISHGNFDKRLSIKTGDEIEDVAEAFNQMVDNLQEEERAAAELQSRLLPPKKIRVQGIKLHAQQVQAKLVGGDWYDYYQSNNSIAFLIADASGKGMSGALIATLAMSALRSEVKTPETIDMVLRKTNRTIEQRLGTDNFITLFYAHLALDTRELSYINCGHELPIYYSAEEKKWTMIECRSSLPLGISTEHFYPRKEYLQLNKGDKLILYTDGLHDARDAERRFFSLETILAWLNDNNDYAVDLTVDELMTKAVDFCDGQIVDDITLLGLEIVSDPLHPRQSVAESDSEKVQVG